MASLTGKTPSATYKDLLQVSNSNSGVDGTLRSVEDGEGSTSALQVSTAGVKSTGTLEVDGATTLTGELTADTIASSTLDVILAAVYPIGSYYINETNSTNPATLLGFGTWTAVQDMVLMARGSTYTGTGGNATVTLTTSELPAHTHTFAINNSTANTNYPTGANSWAGAAGGGASLFQTASSDTNVPFGVNSSGSGSAFSIIPPYQAAYVWKRTA